MYDLIIIGAGPAGMSAGIFAARRKLNFLILSLDVGGQMAWSSEVDNYPGIPDVTGVEIVNKFKEHMRDYKIKIKNEEVKRVRKKGKLVEVKTDKNLYQSKAVIISSGKKPKKLNVKGEDKFSVKQGLSYCAVCDISFCKNKKVAIVGSGNSGLEAATYLSKYAKKVYILEMMPKLMGEKYLKDKILRDKKVSVITGAKIKEIFGNKSVGGLKYEKGGKEQNLKVERIFVEIGLISKSDFTDAKKNKWGEIMIFRSTKTNEENLTSVEGIFAAGDCTDIPAKHIIVAAGEGAKAAIASFDCINKWGKS